MQPLPDRGGPLVVLLVEVVPEDDGRRQVGHEAEEQLASARLPRQVPGGAQPGQGHLAQQLALGVEQAHPRRGVLQVTGRQATAHVGDRLQRVRSLGDDLLPAARGRACAGRRRTRGSAAPPRWPPGTGDRRAPRPAGRWRRARRRRPPGRAGPACGCRSGTAPTWPSPATPRSPASGRRATAARWASPSDRAPPRTPWDPGRDRCPAGESGRCGGTSPRRGARYRRADSGCSRSPCRRAARPPSRPGCG